MYLPLSLLFLCVGTLDSFEITAETTLEQFPVQVPNWNNPNSFFKIGRDEIEELSCPPGYVFDAAKLICVKTEDGVPQDDCLRLNLRTGNWPNLDSCRTFFSCNAQCCYAMSCPANLLYNPARDLCDYPLDADCCEYREKDPDRLVQ